MRIEDLENMLIEECGENNKRFNWLATFRVFYSIYVIISIKGSRREEDSTKWCVEKFGMWGGFGEDGKFDARPGGSWDWGEVAEYRVFGFSEKIPTNDLIEFKLRFG